MKKIKTAIFVIVVFVVANFFSEFANDISRNLVHHIEAGNFINTDDLDTIQLTMLHWFSDEVQVYSEDKKELNFVVFNPYNGLTLYKNKELIMQNESKNYPNYQQSNYMVFNIDNDDYIDNRVNFYSDVTLGNKGKKEYERNYFVGTYDVIINLITNKNFVGIFSKSLFVIFILFLLFLIKDKTALFALFLLYIFIDVKVGVLIAVTLLYFYSDFLFKKRTKRYLVPMLMLLCLALPFIDGYV